MKKFLFTLYILFATIASIYAKVGDRLEYKNLMNPACTLICEIISEEEKTCKIVDVVWNTPGETEGFLLWVDQSDPEIINPEFRDYRIVEVDKYAVRDLDLGAHISLIQLDGISTIQDYAFWGVCRKKGTQLSVGKNLVSIGEYAFANAQLSSIDLRSYPKPPIAHLNSFSKLSYAKCAVYVTYPEIYIYVNHPIWGRFAGLRVKSGINDAENLSGDIKINGNEAILNNFPQDTTAYLYDLSGRLIDSITLNDNSSNTLNFPAPGTYIIKSGSFIKKIYIGQ